MACNQPCSVCRYKGDIAYMHTLKKKANWPRRLTSHQTKQISKYSQGYICGRCKVAAEKIVGDEFFLRYSDHAASSTMMAALQKAGLIK